MMKFDSLLQEIEYLRKQLVILVKEKGYTHEQTIKTSQQLDVVLNEYTDKVNKES